MAQYRDLLVNHLESYKQDVLNISESGKWGGKEYGHILPTKSKFLNLLPEIREACIAYIEAQEISLHRGFANLNSSQALCFNLFFPLVLSNSFASEFVRTILKIEGEVASCHFELVYADGSNIDFVIKMENDSSLLFECKLTEREFGVADEDEEHCLKLEQVYRPKLQGSVKEEFLQPTPFFKNYQLLRNVFCLNPNVGDRLYFLYPEQNEALVDARPIEFLRNSLVPALFERVQVLGLSSLIQNLKTVARNAAAFVNHYDGVQRKYLCHSV